MNRLGDIQDPSLRRTIQDYIHLGRQRWIVKPEWVPPAIPGMESQQALIDSHILPRLWQLLSDYQVGLLERGTYHVQLPGWISAPITSEPEDRVSEDPVPLANGSSTVVVSYQCPDRHYAAFKWFGHMLDVAAQWGVVTWSVLINKRPYRTWNAFKQQRGTVVQPTEISRPITLKPKDILQIVATGGPVSVNALARISGWSIAASSVDQSGENSGFKVR